MQSPDALKVTVLIDTYNYARFLERAIDSALHQDYAGLPPQILVVDDGSTDNTAEVVGRYAGLVRYIAKSNGGQASTLNVGFGNAEGDIVCLLDGDDYFYPGKLQAVADTFQSRPEVGLVYDEFDIVDGNGTSLGKVFPEPTWTGHRLPLSRVPAQLRQLILLGHPWTCITSAMSVRRSVVADLAIPEDVFHHSPDLFLGLVLPFLAEVAIIETPATAYVYHGQNVGLFRSSSVNRAMHDRQMDFIRRFIEERFKVQFLRYAGRSMYCQGQDRRTGAGRFAEYLKECRQIAVADVEPSIKRRSQARLAAGTFLPNVVYGALREVKAKLGTWRNRGFRRRIAAARRQGEWAVE
jgi:glycosyltransferase involved in cell wall biosynthesis